MEIGNPYPKLIKMLEDTLKIQQNGNIAQPTNLKLALTSIPYVSESDIQLSPGSYLRLIPELVPSMAWGLNIRNISTKGTWDIIRKRIYQKYNYRCTICNGVGLHHPVECHETWWFDDITHIIYLIGLTALCPMCHSVKHLGQTQARGEEQLVQAIKHMSYVNSITIDECHNYIRYFDDINAMRSQYEWAINYSTLIQHAPELANDNVFLQIVMITE